MNVVNIQFPFSMSFLDFPDPEAHAVVVYMMGCDNVCEGCQNPEFKNPNFSESTEEFTALKLLFEVAKSLKKHRTSNIVLTGGDPFSKHNRQFTQEFLLMTHDWKTCVYTGHDIEYVKEYSLCGFDYLICNPYDKTKKVLSEKTDEYFQLASTNQEIYYGKELISKNGKLIFELFNATS